VEYGIDANHETKFVHICHLESLNNKTLSMQIEEHEHSYQEWEQYVVIATSMK
jgi:hypothetical protein